MARSNLAGLAWSLEDEDVIVEEEGGGAGGDEEVLSGDETVEGEMLEVADATEEVSEVNDNIDGLVDDADAVEQVAAVMEHYAANGGMTKDVAFVSQVAIRNIIKKYPALSLRSVGQPALESFGQSGKRLAATTASLEGIRQLLSDFWAMIMKQINKLTAYIRNWYLKVLDAAPRLKKRAEAIVERAGDTTGTIDEKKMDLGLAKDLSLKGKAPGATDLISALEMLKAGAADSLSAKSAQAYEDAMTNTLNILEKVVDGKLDASVENFMVSFEVDLNRPEGYKTSNGAPSRRDAREAAAASGSGGGTIPAQEAETYAAALKKDFAKAAAGWGSLTKVANDDQRFGNKADVSHSAELPGGQAVFLSVPNSEGNASVKLAAKNSKLMLMALSAKAKAVDSTGSFETLATAQVETIGGVVAEICETIMAYKKAWDARDKQQKRMDTEVKKAISQSEKDKEADGNRAKQVRECGDAISSVWRQGVQFESTLINYLIKVGRSSLSYCERSLAQYKK